jgi:phosphohistidine phosphatase SixA
MPMKSRCLWLLAFTFAALALSTGGTIAASEDAAWNALRAGGIALFRHANAPGVGDPPGMRLDDCSTQRNLDERGRVQARRIGDAFRSRNIQMGAVLASQWCRATETALLAFPGLVRVDPVFNSFFGDQQAGELQTETARRLLQGWQGPGTLFVSTHQVNITALTGLVPASGEGIVLGSGEGGLAVVGRIRP